MRARIIVAAAIAALVLAGASAASGAAGEQRTRVGPAPAEGSALPSSLAKTRSAVDGLARSGVKCRTLRCINRALTGIATSVKRLVDCMSWITVARYDGYLFSNDGGTFTTTALDEVPPGQPGTRVLILAC
jgi:hypothetical protein